MKKAFLLCVFLCSCFLAMIHILFKINAPYQWMVAEWTAGELITFVGTMTLGGVAFWQNKNLKESNESQNYTNLAMEKYPLFCFENFTADELHVTDLEMYKIINSKKITCFGEKSTFQFPISSTEYPIRLSFTLKNIGEYPAVNLYLTNKNKIYDDYYLKDLDGNSLEDSYLLKNEKIKIFIDFNVCDPNVMNENLLLEFTNPFGCCYDQKINFSIENQLITVKTDLVINLKPKSTISNFCKSK